METNFEPGRRFANHLDFQLQLDAWFAKANVRTHKTLRVPPDPHVRFDTDDYSLDPNLVGRRVEIRASQREIIAAALDAG